MAITGRDKSGKITAAEGGGRKPGSKNRSTKDMREAFRAHFEEIGHTALDIVFKESPKDYLKIFASILPKELFVSDKRFGNMTDDEILASIAEGRRILSALDKREDSGERSGARGGAKPPTIN
jgi:hypothetical protein